jgi:hypothetical protein
VTIFRTIAAVLCLVGTTWTASPAPGEPGSAPGEAELLAGEIFIEPSPLPEERGYAYTLIYVVDVPLSVFWKFKTDFDNDFLTSNPLITSHRLIGRDGDSVLTETTYATGPHTVFRWRTTARETIHQLDFRLVNAREVGQDYHLGWIRLTPLGNRTKVTQTVQFNFFGAYFWVHYPWYGGMSYFLKHTVQWERTAVKRLFSRYSD